MSEKLTDTPSTTTINNKKQLQEDFRNAVSFINPLIDFADRLKLVSSYKLYKQAFPKDEKVPALSRNYTLYYHKGDDLLALSLNPDYSTLIVNKTIIKRRSRKMQYVHDICKDLKKKYHISDESLATLRAVVKRDCFEHKPVDKGYVTAFQLLEKLYLSAIINNTSTLGDLTPTFTEERFVIAKKGKYLFKIDVNETPVIAQKLNLETMQIEELLPEEKKYIQKSLSARYSGYLEEHRSLANLFTRDHPVYTEYFAKEQKEALALLQNGDDPLNKLYRELILAFQESLKKQYSLDDSLNNSSLTMDSNILTDRVSKSILNELPHLMGEKDLLTPSILPDGEKENMQLYPISDDGIIKLTTPNDEKIQRNIQKIHDALEQRLAPEKDPADLLLPIENIFQQHSVIISNPFLDRKILSKDTKLCNSYIYQLKIMSLQQRRKMTAKAEYNGQDFFELATRPFLCLNHVLYQKKGNFIYKISLNKNHPFFVKHDITTGKRIPLSFDEISQVVNEWNITTKSKKSLLTALEPLYTQYMENPAQYSEPKDNLPNFREAYTLFNLEKEWLKHISDKVSLSDKDREKKDSYFIPFVLTNDGTIVGGDSSKIYKISLVDDITFEKITDRETFLLSPDEMVRIGQALFSEHTLEKAGLSDNLIPVIFDIYRQTLTPVFNEIGKNYSIGVYQTKSGEKFLCVKNLIDERKEPRKLPEEIDIFKMLHAKKRFRE